MEFAVALLSAAASEAASSVLPKLGRVIANLAGDPKTDATFIKLELQFIQYAIRENSFVGCPPLSELVCRTLRGLSYEIEDCLDCFEVKKTSAEEFAAELARLKTRSKETREQIVDYTKIIEDMKKSPGTSSAQGQWQQVAPAAASEVPVPKELQGLVDNQGRLDNLHCLLYFCMFPHDHPARRNPLIRRWLAEGLVGGEDDAVEYLKALIDGKIINTTEKSNNGMAKRCQPPVEILNFIYQQSSSTNFMLFCGDMDKLEADCARRLSLYPNKETLDEMNWPDFPHLHTLAAFHGRYEAILRFRKYKVLRVLDLKEFAPLSKQQILAICKLLLLKYLSFRCGTDQLPSKIGKLAWLETLDMRGSETVTLHEEVLMMPRLKHLLGKFQLSRMDALTFRNWENTELGEFLKQKSFLQTLSGFVTGGRHGFPELMILMRKLKKVKIWCKSNASEANLLAISGAITKFVRDGIQDPGRSLSIDFHECPRQFLNDLQVQEGDLTTSLKLHGKLSKFPQFVARLSGLEELCLSSTALFWSEILAELSNLRVLKYLKLVEDNLGRVEILEEELRSLERLCLVCEPNLDIAIQAGALPGLVSLHLICQNLEVLPGNPGMKIKHMKALEEVGLHSKVGPAMKQAWEIDAEVHPNEPRVFDVCP